MGGVLKMLIIASCVAFGCSSVDGPAKGENIVEQQKIQSEVSKIKLPNGNKNQSVFNGERSSAEAYSEGSAR